MIIEELSIVLISIAGVYGIRKLTKKMKYNIRKKKLKKLLNDGFSVMNTDIIKTAIKALEDFDAKYNTKKLEKYLLEIVNIFRDDDEKPTLNEKNVLGLVEELVFDSIFDDEEEEEERQLSEIEEKMQETKKVLNEVELRRKEIILRKNQIRQGQVIKSGKIRKSGGMG